MAEQKAKYQILIDWIREKIENGTFQEGDKLPSETELGERFDLSRQTVRHATGELEAKNILYKVKGSGTYIGRIFRSTEKPEREQKYYNIAVISTYFEDYIFPSILKGIERVLFQHGYSMQVAFTDNRFGREREILKTILEKDNIDGLIIEPSKSALPNTNMILYEELKARGIPMICFNSYYEGLGIPCVRIDDHSAAAAATQVLIEAGHKKIAGIFKADDGQGRLRYEGYMDALSEAGINTNQNQVLWMDTIMSSRLEEIDEHIFSRIADCSAVVCYNDQVAYQLIDLAQKRGICVPEKLSVIGIDNSSLSQMSHVPFDSMNHPKEILGEKVAENMIRMIEDAMYDGNYLFACEHVKRESVKMQ